MPRTLSEITLDILELAAELKDDEQYGLALDCELLGLRMRAIEREREIARDK